MYVGCSESSSLYFRPSVAIWLVAGGACLAKAKPLAGRMLARGRKLGKFGATIIKRPTESSGVSELPNIRSSVRSLSCPPVQDGLNQFNQWLIRPSNAAKSCLFPCGRSDCDKDPVNSNEFMRWNRDRAPFRFSKFNRFDTLWIHLPISSFQAFIFKLSNFHFSFCACLFVTLLVFLY